MVRGNFHAKILVEALERTRDLNQAQIGKARKSSPFISEVDN